MSGLGNIWIKNSVLIFLNFFPYKFLKIDLCFRLYIELDTKKDIAGYEAFLSKNATTLAENHYLNLSAQHNLYQLYGKVDNYLINNLTEEQLQRKIELCRNLLHAFSKLEPGFSKQRGKQKM